MSSAAQKPTAAIMISGRGSNMIALLKAAEDPEFPVRFTRVLSDKASAPGLMAAKVLGLLTSVVDANDAADIDNKLGDVAITCLAGYMRILPPELVAKRAGRIINIHPSLLPKHKGLNAQAKTLEAGDVAAGATVHFVNDELDGGKIILQHAINVRKDDTVDSLTQRVLAVEHELYPEAVRKVMDQLNAPSVPHEPITG